MRRWAVRQYDRAPNAVRGVIVRKATPSRPAATAVRGLPAGLSALRLALDGAGRPVLAADGVSMAAARRASSGAWTIWPLGNGTLPRLATKADGSVLFAAYTMAGSPGQK